MAQTSEAERIIKLMLLVRESGPIDFASIRERLPYEYGEEAGSFDATRRRFERDKKALQQSGVFLTINDRQQYSLDASLTTAAPLSLTKPQISLLRLLCGALLQDDNYPLKEELRMILVKLGDELEIPDMLPQFELDLGEPHRPHELPGLAKVKKAIASRKRLSFTYADSHGRESERVVEAYGCFFLKDACYVVAFDPSVNEERTFRLDRMSRLKVNGKNPSQPDFKEHPFIASEHYGLPFQFGNEDLVARIFFDESSAMQASRLTMGLGSLELRDDGLLWTTECKDCEALARWCIENGPGIRILEPEDARTCMREGLLAFRAIVKRGGDEHEG